MTPESSGLNSAAQFGSPSAPPPTLARTAAARPAHRPERHANPAPPTSAAAQAGCYPLSNEGTCYKPGEFCRRTDHGMTGRAGDGEAIVCTDNDGWRWEPA